MFINNAREFLRSSQYSTSLLESQNLETAARVIDRNFKTLKRLSKLSTELQRERALIYGDMHRILNKKIKQAVNNPNPGEKMDKVITGGSPVSLDIVILVEISGFIDTLIIDCLQEQVPLNGLRGLKNIIRDSLVDYKDNWDDGKTKLQPTLRF